MENLISSKVLLIRINKTKTGKAVLRYGIPTEPNDYSKGFTELDHWFEGTSQYNNLKGDYFGTIVDAQLEFGKMRNGVAKLQIKNLIHPKTGETLI